MFKLIIIDDEKATREKIVENIDWDKLNIQVSGEAKDGIEGLRLTEQVQPDIILLDVRMPKMNGIQCAAEIRKENQNCKIIFLSGFTDKEYMKSAIQLKAVDYIEKPIDLDELHTVLKKTVLLCMEDNEIGSKITQSSMRIKHDLAVEMIKRNVDAVILKKQFESIHMNISLNENYRCVLLRYNTHKVPGIENNMIIQKEKVLEVIYNEFNAASYPCIACVMDGVHALIHIYGKTAENVVIVKEIMKRIQDSFNTAYQCDGAVTVGVGKLVRGVENIFISYQNAQKALHKSFLKGYNSILFYNDEIHREANISAEDINQKLRNYLNEGSYADIAVFINDIVKAIEDQADTLQIHSIKSIFLSIMLSIPLVAKENGLSIGNTWDSEQLQWAEILNIYTMNEAADFILEKFKVLYSHLEEQRGKSKKIRMVMEFIKKHYMEDISVALIADKLEMRSTYLSTLFKKETGKMLSEYIESVRMEKAKELLKDDRLKLAEVSRLSGYNNANYFTSVFKKVTGEYPSEYRRNHVL